MTRFVSVTVLVMVLAWGGIASAQTATGLPDGETIEFDELRIHEDNSPTLEVPKSGEISLWRYFNLAHCQCGAPGIPADPANYKETTFAYLLKIGMPSATPVGSPVTIWVGSNCADDTPNVRTANCQMAGGVATVDTIKGVTLVRPEISVFQFMAPRLAVPGMPSADDCTKNANGAAASVGTEWLLVDLPGDPITNYSNSKTIPIDLGPPTMPTAITARGGESAIQLSWTPPDDPSDTYAYQALCARATDNSPGKKSGAPAKKYDTAATLCGATTPLALEPVPITTPTDGPDAGVVTLSDDLKNLNPTFLCDEVVSSTATGMRIGGLENGVAYNVVLLAMDKFGNASGAYFTSSITPVPSVDFWEDLEGRDSKVDGGLCLLAETYGDDSSLTTALRAFRDDTLGGSAAGRWLSDAYYATLGKLGAYVHGSIAGRVVAGVLLAPLVALALGWHWLSLPGVLGLLAVIWLWRRRGLTVPRWLVRIAAPIAVLLALVPGAAHAGGYQPYWENSNIQDEQPEVAPDDPSLVKWLVGIRVGPYVPQIDKHFADKPGPYAQMFGGYHIMAMLDVDRVLWAGFGQVAVGVSVGYMQKTARAFTVDSMPSDTNRARAGDQNKFVLIPTALTATYRFTMLDDDYGIPIVPYVRAGLSYYVWWVRDSNGFSTVCKDGSDKATNPTCAKDKALGASLGVQGSIGLAIRAERIDSSTAISMRQSGIQHAGIYGELSLAKVDGFGSESKLSVGDITWFAGVNFEF